MDSCTSIPQPQRILQHNVVSQDVADLLLYILRTNAVVGYRDYVASATIFDIAHNAPMFLPVLAQVRQTIQTILETEFGLGLSLFIEFTGLLGWRTGAAIDYHADDNRQYLQQREYSAVLYLNNTSTDFQGGTFEFKAGSPQSIQPQTGTLIAYHASDTHRVQQVQGGERCALAMWFTTNMDFDEDAKLIELLAGGGNVAGLPASMFMLPGGVDLRLCRLAMQGFGLCTVDSGRVLQSSLDYSENEGEEQQQQQQGVGVVVNCSVHRSLQEDEVKNGQERKGDGIKRLSVEFSSAKAAVETLFWCVKLAAGRRWSTEPVCSKHLSVSRCCSSDAQTDVDCSWLTSASVKTMEETTTADGDVLVQRIVAAQEEWGQVSSGLRSRYEEYLKEWIHVGSLVV